MGNGHGMKDVYERKKYSTSIENHCVVQKQLSISFELLIASVFPFIHFLQRAKQMANRN